MLLSRAGGEKQSAHRRLYDHLEGWLCGGFDGAPYGEGEELIEAVTAGDQDAYVRAQAEALVWLGWAKKFARAFLEKTEGGGDDE
jgi:CRISPR-associated protein Cmr5